MATKNKLGVYFGVNFLSIAEAQKRKLVNFFDAPHSLFEESQTAVTSNIPDEIRLNAIIQKSLRDKKISISDVALSIPTQEIILRSFFIPWMTSGEVKGVVDFEARRYIPFKLEELVYSYHTTTITEKKNRRIRILFIAVRKETLEKYCSILEQAGLRVTYAEPASLSLLRVLMFKKKIQRQKTYAIVQLNSGRGTILIINQHIPQFLRDFQLATSSLESNPETFTERLVSEIRISLDYYRRQYAKNRVDQIIFISDAQTSQNIGSLEQDLSIKTSQMTSQTIFDNEDISLGTLHAYGVSAHDDMAFPVKIDLAKSRAKPPKVAKPLEKAPINFVTTIKFAVVCSLIIACTFGYYSFKIRNFKNNLSRLTEQIGVYEALEESEIKQKTAEESEKLKSYKNVRLNSKVSFFLRRVPELLPSGTWLTNFSIKYSDVSSGKRSRRRKKIQAEETITKVSVQLTGYVYSPDDTQQINLINELMENLRGDNDLSKQFSQIVLKSARKDRIDEHAVTLFQISCN